MLDSLVFLRHQRQNVYVALEELDFVWDEKDVVEVDRLWTDGLSIWDIARAFERDPDEVTLLIIDRTRKGSIRARPGGVWGRRMPHGSISEKEKETNSALAPEHSCSSSG